MAFPTTSVIDSFTRANAGSLGANWTDDPGNFALPGFDIVSNAAEAPVDDVASWYSASTFGADQEVYVTLSTLASGSYPTLIARGVGMSTSGSDWYEVSWRPGTTIIIARQIDSYSSYTQLLNTTSAAASPATGSKFGFSVTGTGATVTLTAYIDTGSGWVEAASTTDTSGSRLVAGGSIGMASRFAGDRYDDFGGGAVVAATGRPSALMLLGVR